MNSVGTADEMVDSNWYRQVTNRADRLVEELSCNASKRWDRTVGWGKVPIAYSRVE